MFALSPLAARVEEKLTLPLLFAARSALGREPTLDPRIKIFSYGDASVARLGKPAELPAGAWAAMIAALQRQKPRAILADFVWSQGPTDDAERAAMHSVFTSAVPVATGAVTADAPIVWRQELPESSPSLLPAGDVETDGGFFLYGPVPEIASISSYVGHVTVRQPGYFEPFVRARGGARLPEMALRIPSDAPLPPTNASGLALVNWINPAAYAARRHDMNDLHAAATNGSAVSSVSAGDVVLMLPEMYTGNGDLDDTFIGRLPRGHAQVAIAHAALTGDWLRQADPGLFGPILGVLGSWALVSWLDFMTAGAAVVAGELLLTLLSGWLFMGEGLAIVSLPTMAAFGGAGLAFLAQRRRQEDVLLAQIDQALHGVVAPSVLERIRRDPSRFHVVASDQMLTALFVDFVGFSNIAERMEPEAMFHSLEEILQGLATIVHAHGGVVDKTVGDGLIAFFGYEPVTGGVDPDHADHALHCAVALQRHLAAFAASRKGTGRPTFLARIGLNSGRAHVGNLGGGRRFEVTIIGHTVNMAKRLEDACEPFRVMLGPNTYGLLSTAAKAQGFEVRKAKIKHKKSYLDAFECDPFAGDTKVLREALNAHRAFAGLDRGQERHILPAGTRAYIVTEGRRAGEIIDFSPSGLQIRLESLYFASRVRFWFTIEVEHAGGRVQTVAGCQAIVKWGRKGADGYLHGVELEEPTPDLRKLLIDFENSVSVA